MKKITFLMMLLATTFGYAQTPTGAAPTPPTRDAGDVISVFTQTTDATTTVYDDISVANFNPNWGSTSGNVTINPYGGDRALTYPNFDYQGIIIGSEINVTAMTTLHVDIWTNSVSPNVYLISQTTGERFVNVAAVPGQWTSVEIPLSDFSNQGLGLNDIKEFKFATDSGPSGTSIYIDNLYFARPALDPLTDATLIDLKIDGMTIPGFGSTTFTYNFPVAAGTTVVPQITAATTNNPNASTVITQASAIPGSASVVVTAENGTDTETYSVSIFAEGPTTPAPTPPGRPAADVISIFSDAYTDISVDTYDTDWCGATTTEVMIEGNATHKISGLGCEGIDFQSGRFDGTTEMTRFHMDIWTETNLQDKSFNFKFSDWNGSGGEVGAYEYSATNANILTVGNEGTWISIDLPLSAFNVINGVDGTDFVQFVITSDLGTVYYDNLYLHKNTVLSTNEFDLESVSVSPNPTSNNWNVKTSNGQNITAVEVYDILGKQVLRAVPNASEYAINASELNDGIYLAKIVSNTGSTTIKLVKN